MFSHNFGYLFVFSPEFTSVMVDISPLDNTSTLSHCADTVHASFYLAGKKVNLLLERNINIVRNIPVIISSVKSEFEHWTMHNVSEYFVINKCILK